MTSSATSQCTSNYYRLKTIRSHETAQMLSQVNGGFILRGRITLFIVTQNKRTERKENVSQALSLIFGKGSGVWWDPLNTGFKALRDKDSRLSGVSGKT